jgi:hypothetical protein
MNYTCKFISILIVFLSFISCDETKIKHIQNFYLINNTGKRIVHKVKCNKEYTGLDTLTYYSEGAFENADFEWEIVGIFDIGRQINVIAEETNIYNITDTISLGWSDIPGSGGIYTHFGENINNTSYKDGDYYTFTGDYFLTVDNELLSLMKKDYTMLDKFKEYYQK